MSDLERMKKILREEDYPMFSDDDLNFYIAENNGNVDAAIYQCLILKSESNAVSITGLSAEDSSSSYFKRLASQYKPSNSCNL
jgi:hypothetical protein